MRKISAIIETGFAGCVHVDEFEVDDDCTEEEIEEMVQNFLSNHISVSWKEIKE